jgi:excisionase family DNA binding protein
VNKKEVAEYLNLSTRAVERAVERGKLSVQYRKDRYGNAAVFDFAEVQRLRAETEIPPPRPAKPWPPNAPEDSPSSPLVLGSAISLSEGSGGIERVPIVAKLTLSLSEASRLSGLSEQFLLKAIHDKTLAAFEAEGNRRVKRTELDRFIQDL